MVAEPIGSEQDALKRYDIDSIDNRDPALVERLMTVLEGPLWRYFRPVITGLEHIPAGPALYVGNHNAGPLTPDTFTFCVAAYREHGIDALPYGLGHEVAIQIPFAHQLLVPLGAVRASHDTAHRLFARGKKALVYPGGDIDSWRSYADRDRVVFGPRRGYIRLALREDVAIIPVVSAGAQETWIVLNDGRWLAKLLRTDALFRIKAWPFVLSIPWGLTIGPPPPYIPLRTRIHQEILPPIRFERSGDEAAEDADYVERCHERVLGMMQATLTRRAARRRAAMAP